MERKNNVWLFIIGSILGWVITTIGCTLQLSDQNEGDISITPTALKISTPTKLVDYTPTPSPVTFLTPTLPAGARTTLPDGLANMMDPSFCPRACYLGFMPGQTKEEVLTILQSLNVRQIEIVDQEDPLEGTTGIKWPWGIVAFRDGYSIFFSVSSGYIMPISLVLDQFGEPDYIDIVGVIGDDWFYGLIYLYQDTAIVFGAYNLQPDSPSFLSGNTPLQKIGVEDIESYFTWICGDGWEHKLQKWKGYGGLGVYFDENGQLLDQVSIVDCDDYKQ